MSDTRSEYEKPLEYPLCAKCGREIIRCGHHWVYTRPRGEHGAVTAAERAQRDRHFEQEKARAQALVAEGRMSPETLVTLGFEQRVERIEALVEQVAACVLPASKPAQPQLAQPALLAPDAPPSILVFLDTETTGRGGNHQPIEIAAKALNADGTALEPAKCFWLRLRLFEGVYLDHGAYAVHGLDCESPEWHRTATDPKLALERFAAWWPAGAVLVAHNATFDANMLLRAFERAGVQPPAWGKPICSLQLARKRGFKPAGLADLCTRFGVSNEGAHGARADVNRLIAVWPHIQRSAA